MDDSGFGFWVKLVGLFVVGAIALFVFLVLFLSVVYAWGFLGIVVVLLLTGLIYDRRQRHHHGTSY